jgi:hypothetical protein
LRLGLKPAHKFTQANIFNDLSALLRNFFAPSARHCEEPATKQSRDHRAATVALDRRVALARSSR